MKCPNCGHDVEQVKQIISTTQPVIWDTVTFKMQAEYDRWKARMLAQRSGKIETPLLIDKGKTGRT